MPPSVDVIVPVHGGFALTASCLEHLRAQTLRHRVIVVDDASPDDTAQRVAASFPETLVLRQPGNRGFAAACNRGIAAGEGEVVTLLNNDVDVAPDFLERLAAPFAHDARLGSVAPLLVRPGGERIDQVGLAADPTLAGFPRLAGAPVARAGERLPALLGPSGGAAGYRRAALADVGGLDERIFMYQEDLDLALRLRAAGWSTVAEPRARGVHHGGATAGRRSAFQRRVAGFARGYLLRRYGVLRSAAGPRAALTELIVVAGDAVLCRDLAALRGRVAGWREGGRAPRRRAPAEGVEPAIGLRESLRLRRADHAAAR